MPTLAIQTHRCGRCGGGWLPFANVPEMLRTFVQRVLRDSFQGEERQRQHLRAARLLEKWEQDQQELSVSDEIRDPCPQCLEPMRKLRSQTNIYLIYDCCDSCHGFWLDKGEMEGLAKVVSKQLVALTSPS